MAEQLTNAALDEAVCALLEPKPEKPPHSLLVWDAPHWHAIHDSAGKWWWEPRAISKSLDAALLAYQQLRDKRWPGALLTISENTLQPDQRWEANIELEDGEPDVFALADTPARAVCLALVEAAETTDAVPAADRKGGA